MKVTIDVDKIAKYALSLMNGALLGSMIAYYFNGAVQKGTAIWQKNEELDLMRERNHIELHKVLLKEKELLAKEEADEDVEEVVEDDPKEDDKEDE